MSITSFFPYKPTTGQWLAIEKYVKLIKQHGENYAILISLSNGAVSYLNAQVRNRLYRKPDPELHPGEWLMVIQNNYLTGYNNGQHIRLKSFTDSGETVGTVRLIDAITVDTETGVEKEVKIVKDLLFRSAVSLTEEEEKVFLIDFVMRMNQSGIKTGSENFIHYLTADKRFNALRVKFGYAITCHKAQGGEWNHVFVNIEPAFEKLSRDGQYRWMYTAITRVAQRLILPKHSIIY
jgi:hypothetical protein